MGYNPCSMVWLWPDTFEPQLWDLCYQGQQLQAGPPRGKLVTNGGLEEQFKKPLTTVCFKVRACWIIEHRPKHLNNLTITAASGVIGCMCRGGKLSWIWCALLSPFVRTNVCNTMNALAEKLFFAIIPFKQLLVSQSYNSRLLYTAIECYYL